MAIDTHSNTYTKKYILFTFLAFFMKEISLWARMVNVKEFHMPLTLSPSLRPLEEHIQPKLVREEL